MLVDLHNIIGILHEPVGQLRNVYQPIHAFFQFHEQTVVGHVADDAGVAGIDSILLEYKPIAHKIRHIIDTLSPQGVQRERNLEDGDEIDINAAVDAMIAIRMGKQPDTRITMRNAIKNRDLAVTVLLDLSESTNETINGADKTVLDLTREAATLVSTAISGIGDPFAVHGFASEGRHDVHYYRFKDFNQKFDHDVKARLDGMKGGLSTRMGAAKRSLRLRGRRFVPEREAVGSARNRQRNTD